MAILVTHACKFAVRGGGHMSWAGAANIDASGVTIDLSAMKQVEVSDDRTITSVGGGARWEDVYLKLDALDLAVSGGRVAAVGVGGLITGGGNSFFASRYGFACDNVQNFEVVLASGKIVNANIHEHRGLYRALKGGTNNFGIVTRFDLQTFSQGKLWGGMIYNPIESAALQFQYLEDFTTASGNGVDDHASIINAYIFTAAGPSLVANQFTYTKPEPFPSILCNFTDLQPQMSNTLRTTNLTNLTIELGQGTPNGLRQQFGTATFSNNATLFAHIFALATEIFEPIQSIDNFLASFVLQPISKAITSRAHLTGGNSLGISAQDGNLVWLDLTLQWSSPTDDAAVTNATQTLLRCATAYAKAQGLHHDFLYLNYALQTQDPIAGYGSESVAHLRNMSGLYDPSGVFQRLVPGGFKLWREDVGCCG
ncbi:hypothetical protein MMC19_007536 [Ptychographa xylographoides]|nr:hypothetical protein [Ptychographa xylographoides]